MFAVAYRFDDSDWLAVEMGIEALQSDGEAFSYPMAGQQELAVSLGRDPGGDEITARVTGRPDRLLGARLGAIMDAFSLSPSIRRLGQDELRWRDGSRVRVGGGPGNRPLRPPGSAL
jgi:hypothetical protein